MKKSPGIISDASTMKDVSIPCTRTEKWILFKFQKMTNQVQLKRMLTSIHIMIDCLHGRRETKKSSRTRLENSIAECGWFHTKVGRKGKNAFSGHQGFCSHPRLIMSQSNLNIFRTWKILWHKNFFQNTQATSSCGNECHSLPSSSGSVDTTIAWFLLKTNQAIGQRTQMASERFAGTSKEKSKCQKLAKQ